MNSVFTRERKRSRRPVFSRGAGSELRERVQANQTPPAREGMCVIGRADASGLAAMTFDFCKAMRPERALIVNCSSRGRTHAEHIACDDVLLVEMDDLANEKVLDRFLKGMKYVVGFETFYRKDVLKFAAARNVGTVLFPMWECTGAEYEACDAMVCVTDKDAAYYTDGIRIDWPMGNGFVHPRKQNPPEVFLHNGGTFGYHGRNNTKEVVQASKALKGTNAEVFVRSIEEPESGWREDHENCHWRVECIPRKELYAGADVFVFPTGISGLCLPLLEAAFLGIPSIVMDLPQFRAWPEELKLRPAKVEAIPIGFRAVEYHRPDPGELGAILRALADGKLVPAPPPPPPTWRAFTASWEAKVESRF